MKNMFFLFASSLIITTVHAKVPAFNDSPKVVPFSEFSVEKIQEFINSENPDFVIELKEGTSFPLQFLNKNRVFSLLLDPNLTFKVDKDCFVRVSNKKCYMSDDLVHWDKAKDFIAGEAMAQLKHSSSKPGFVLETHVPAYQEYDDMEEED